eukprot:1166134-Prymnesium_polylepis.1
MAGASDGGRNRHDGRGRERQGSPPTRQRADRALHARRLLGAVDAPLGGGSSRRRHAARPCRHQPRLGA